eukprot:4131027-Pyramimonas_sp.AAC.1
MAELFFFTEIRELIDEVRELSAKARAAAASSARASWSDWLKVGLVNGGRRVHAALRGPERWNPITTLSVGGS